LRGRGRIGCVHGFVTADIDLGILVVRVAFELAFELTLGVPGMDRRLVLFASVHSDGSLA
jgi:hypothetical protein